MIGANTTAATSGVAGPRETSRKADTGFMPVLPPRFALFELAVFAAIVACELWVEAFPDFSRLNPHPYWIAVLLLSLQYGTVSGLLAAALAIGGTLLIGLPEAEIGEAYFTYLVRVWTQPVLWIVVALLLGSFRMRQIEERDGLQRQVDDATARSAALSGYSSGLKARVDTLERQLAVSAKPDTAVLLEAFARIADAQSAEIRMSAASEALALVLPGAEASVLAADGDHLRVVLSQSASAGRVKPDLAADTPLVRTLVQEGRIVSVLAASDDLLLGPDCRAVVPILAPDGTLAGAIRIEAVAARDLDHRFLQRLDVLGRALIPVVMPQVATARERGAVVPLVRRSGRMAPRPAATRPLR